ncbi:MAG TPA: hypothetical protein VMF32_09815, partial [Xanthobacteraceae bacterium]|nr:hypothetical protein [Xanthobacteraceae bacterium]
MLAENDERKDGVAAVALLMPVWGYRFVGRFLEFCLPTLLAPNNIPALTRELPCRFILLSSENDVALIQSHPTWQKLAQVCAAEIQLIDDLITEGNHTATITLAFERAIRQAGEAMRQTCFMFLMSDYIIADGSLRSALGAIRNGASGVQVGNFQATAEDLAPVLRDAADPANSGIVLSPRELMRLSLPHLHPATIANIVNIGITHNAHTNRLFWRVDENTLIGRFYLMHAIAIHPEVTDFVIGSSWDYSFIPELCPSGKLATLTDSDDYLVVELQPRGYEADNLRPGPIDSAELALSLAEWTTAGHRANVERTLVFHAADAPPQLSATVALSDGFLEIVRKALVGPPAPHRNHPYWIGSRAVNRHRSRRPLDKSDWTFLLADAAKDAPPKHAMFEPLRALLFGYRPGITRSHPLWPDFAQAIRALNEALSSNGRLLLVASKPASFAEWVVRTTGDVLTLSADDLLNLSRQAYLPLVGSIDCCLLVLSESQLGFCDEYIERICPLMRKSGQVNILVLNEWAVGSALLFSGIFTREVSRLLAQGLSDVEVWYMPSSEGRWLLRAYLSKLLHHAAKRSPVVEPIVT